MNLGINIERKNDISIIHLIGDVYVNTINILFEVIEAQTKRRTKILALNCSRLSSIDPNSLALLKKYISSKLMKVVAINVSPKVQKIMKANDFDENIEILTSKIFESEFIKKAKKTRKLPQKTENPILSLLPGNILFK